MEGDNIVHVVDTVLMPPGYDIYDDFYEDVTRTSIIKRLLEKTGKRTISLHTLSQFKQLGLDHQRAKKLDRKLYALSVMYANKLVTTTGVLLKARLLLAARSWSRLRGGGDSRLF
eukprot:1160731-Pelagomonas_calceolata.AAC.13